MKPSTINEMTVLAALATFTERASMGAIVDRIGLRRANTGLDPDYYRGCNKIQRMVHKLKKAGHADYLSAGFAGWQITDAGRSALAAMQ